MEYFFPRLIFNLFSMTFLPVRSWLLFSHWIILVRFSAHIIPNHVSNPSKYQAKVHKVLRNVRESEHREISQRMKFVNQQNDKRDDDRNLLESLPLSIKQSGTPILELYVRRLGSGPWTPFLEQAVSVNEVDRILIISKFYCEGGINAELNLPEIESWLVQKVYGKGLGEPVYLDRIRNHFNAFAKLKARAFEFGFKLYSYDEPLSVSILPRKRATEFSRRLGSIQSPDQCVSSIDVSSIIQNVQKNGTLNAFFSSNTVLTGLRSALGQFIDSLGQSAARKEILVVSDGSAYLRGRSCLDASAGVVVMARLSDTSGGLFASRDDPVERLLSLRVAGAAGVVATPFDAELIAGLTAITIARIIGDVLTLSSAAEVTHSFLLITDSRTLCRSVRTGRPPQSESIEGEMDPSARAEGDINHSAKNSRQILWDLMTLHMNHTKLSGKAVFL